MEFHPRTAPATDLDAPRRTLDGAAALTGSGSSLGRRVLERFRSDPGISEVRVVDPRLGDGELDELLRGVSCLVHLAFVDDTEWRPRRTELDNVAGARRLFRAAARGGVSHIVLLSSAMVYGAWPNNPVPLSEASPLRPNPEFSFATQHAQIEQLLADWVAADSSRTGAALRASIALGDGAAAGWVMRSLAAAAGARVGEEDPPAQFLHLDDLVAAIDLARVERLDGPFNVAPDGWIPGETVRALAGSAPRLSLPAPVAHRLARWRWKFQRGPIPPGLLPYASAPWVVANDALRSAGWRPRRTNEQAYVAGTETKWWTVLSPKRKQELSLGAAAVLGVSIALAAVKAIRRAVRSHRA